MEIDFLAGARAFLDGSLRGDGFVRDDRKVVDSLSGGGGTPKPEALPCHWT